jgi:hypothetical protein
MEKTVRRQATLVLLGVLGVMFVVTAAGATEAYPWRDHAAPFDFEFGNHVDTHQQSLAEDGILQGFFYITFTGETNAGSDLPIAQHGNCSAADVDCEVGWLWHGVTWSAEYCGHPADGGHPTWAIADADKYLKRGYSHFHWLNESEHAGGLTVGRMYSGYLLRLTAIDSFFFAHHGGFATRPGIDRASHGNLVADCQELG